MVNAAGLSATGPYRVPHVSIVSMCIYTNLPPGGPYRGFGYSEFMFGLELHMTRLAKELGIDPVEFRRINGVDAGRVGPSFSSTPWRSRSRARRSGLPSTWAQ